MPVGSLVTLPLPRAIYGYVQAVLVQGEGGGDGFVAVHGEIPGVIEVIDEFTGIWATPACERPARIRNGFPRVAV